MKNAESQNSKSGIESKRILHKRIDSQDRYTLQDIENDFDGTLKKILEEGYDAGWAARERENGYSNKKSIWLVRKLENYFEITHMFFVFELMYKWNLLRSRNKFSFFLADLIQSMVFTYLFMAVCITLLSVIFMLILPSIILIIQANPDSLRDILDPLNFVLMNFLSDGNFTVAFTLVTGFVWISWSIYCYATRTSDQKKSSPVIATQ